MSDEADRLMEAIIVALVQAFRDPRRVGLQENGMDERDLAFEALSFDPLDMETARYVGARRRGILRTYRHMESIGLLKLVDRSGIFRVFPTKVTVIYYDYLIQPFWNRWFLCLRKRAPVSLSSIPKVNEH